MDDSVMSMNKNGECMIMAKDYLCMLLMPYMLFEVWDFGMYLLIHMLLTDRVLVHTHIESIPETWSRGDQVYTVEVPVM